MKRSRRVVLTLMGSVAVSTVSMGFVRRSDCGPDRLARRRLDDGAPLAGDCRVRYGGFGTTPRRFQFPGGGG